MAHSPTRPTGEKSTKTGKSSWPLEASSSSARTASPRHWSGCGRASTLALLLSQVLLQRFRHGLVEALARLLTESSEPQGQLTGNARRELSDQLQVGSLRLGVHRLLTLTTLPPHRFPPPVLSILGCPRNPKEKRLPGGNVRSAQTRGGKEAAGKGGQAGRKRRPPPWPLARTIKSIAWCSRYLPLAAGWG